MDEREAESLLLGAIPRTAGVWADVGAGEGTFTRALLRLLGPDATVYAIDRDPEVLAQFALGVSGGSVIPVAADIAQPFDLPGGAPPEFDGMLFANVLHYFRDPAQLLERFIAWLDPRGRIVIVEYEGRRANRWVPYPIPRHQLSELVRRVGLSPPTFTATRPSAYGGTMYVAFAER